MDRLYDRLAWLLLLLLLSRMKAGVGAAEFDTTGEDLIVNADTECSFPAIVGKTFRRISIAGRLVVDKDTVGRYATQRADTEVVITSTGVLTASGQGFSSGQGPGHGVTREISGTGGKSLFAVARSNL